MGNDTDTTINYGFELNLSCLCIAQAWMCAMMISSRWWFTWWYLIASWSHDLQDAPGCSDQNWLATLCSLCHHSHVLAVFPHLYISPHVYSLPLSTQMSRNHPFQGWSAYWVYVIQVPITNAHNWIQVSTTQSVHVLFATYRTISVSERKQVPFLASKASLITLIAIRQARPVYGAWRL